MVVRGGGWKSNVISWAAKSSPLSPSKEKRLFSCFLFETAHLGSLSKVEISDGVARSSPAAFLGLCCPEIRIWPCSFHNTEK